MGYARKDKPQNLATSETVYEDPDYDRLRAFQRVRHDERVAAGLLAGGSTIETLGGLIAVVVAVIGLGYQQVLLCAIATIAIGVGLLVEGASVAARWRETARK